ncbi:rod shape-determining protein MreD [Haloimpatiens sp. FM7315]|uniref:rod shape-determining protein MreD n=1 Tax=Haloimpatiens sp. FM7315 TaxID=3298609 RepID=UPI003709CE0F
MKRIIVVFFLSILFLILDNALMPFISIKGFYPSLLFIFAVSYSIAQDEKAALKVGIFSGALQDIYFYHGFGINVFTNMLICLMAAYIGKIIFKEKKFIPSITVFAASFIKGVLVYIIFYVLKIHMDVDKILFISLYNMILGIFMYAYVYKLSMKNFMKRDWKFK